MRPVEIQKLIDWLKEPGRQVARGCFKDADGNLCAAGKLYSDAGLLDKYGMISSGEPLGFGKGTFAHRLGITKRVWSRITCLNDTAGALVVAHYLEQQFPV